MVYFLFCLLLKKRLVAKMWNSTFFSQMHFWHFFYRNNNHHPPVFQVVWPKATSLKIVRSTLGTFMVCSDWIVIFFGGREYFHVEKSEKLKWLKKYFFVFLTYFVAGVPTLTAIFSLFHLAPETRYAEKLNNRKKFFSLEILGDLFEKFNHQKIKWNFWP